MRLTGDLVVFVTGGASGLGEATVRYLHAQGCKVAIADMNEDRLNDLKNELKTNVYTALVDVTDENSVKAAIDGTVKTFGTIHACVACAGVGSIVPTFSTKAPLNTEAFKKTMEINVTG